MRVLVNIQSRVPGFSFSRRIETLSPKIDFFVVAQLEIRSLQQGWPHP
jgi:hypothetical protein